MSGLIFQEAYGPLSRRQWQVYRRYNVSPADHMMIVDVLGYSEDDHDAIVQHVLRNLRNGNYVAHLGITP